MPEIDSAVLIIDHDLEIFDILSKYKGELALRVSYADTLKEGLEKNQSEGYQVILMRDSLTDGDSCFIVQEFQHDAHPPEIIIFTDNGDLAQAEIALRNGVWDYVVTSSLKKKLPELLQRAIRYRHSKKNYDELPQHQIRDKLKPHGIIGHSSLIRKSIDFAAKIAPSDSNVLITGETGTGKELFARVIHNLSSRASKNMTIVDCASLPTSLVESILFGHAKGSFTGAEKKQPGLIKQSDGGTLFLDEVGEMPPEIQKKFLRVLQERKYLPVGGNVETTSNFRLIAATNKDLQVMVDQNMFRKDLLFRLKTFQLELPPLRMRTSDITELAYFFRDDFCMRNKTRKKKLSSDFVMLLLKYDWPGNVRELFQAIECAIASAEDSIILYAKHLPLNIRIQVTRNIIQQMAPTQMDNRKDGSDGFKDQEMPTLKDARDRAVAEQEKKYLSKLLVLSGRNVRKCCETSGLSRSRFYDLLKKYQLPSKN